MPRIQTIEKTGKQWKLGQVLGVLAILVGLCMGFSGTETEEIGTGLMVSVAGVLLWIGSRICAWWYHA